MNTSIPTQFVLILLTIIFILGFPQSYSLLHAASTDVVISEIQVGGQTANDEFVELYNPTDTLMDLSGWRLSRRSSAISGSITNLVTNMTGQIEPHGYFLIANPNYTGIIAPDLFYSATTSGIAANNTVILFRDNGVTVVDKVAMGTAEDAETSAAVLPENSTSIERKAHNNSTSETMGQNGLDELKGNGYDSDQNNQDFILRAIPQPQNKLSPKEPITPIPSPTVLPTSTPIPTETPDITPTSTPIPTPTIPPQISPTVTIAPTIIPTPTGIPTPTPTSRQTMKEYHITSFNKLVCTWNYYPLQIITKILWIPSIHCEVITR